MQRSLLALGLLLGLVGMAAAVGAPGPAPADLLADDELSPFDYDSILGFVDNKKGHEMLSEFVQKVVAEQLLLDYEDELTSSNFTATFFAPVDDAFTAIDPTVGAAVAANSSLLANVIKYHIVPGQALTLADIKLLNGQSLPTLLEGQDLGFKDVGALKALLLTTSGQEVPIYQYNSRAGQVIVHTIKNVLVPGDKPLFAPAPTAL